MESQDETLTITQAIGERLQQERTRLGLTQAKFAAAFGVARITYLGYEAGRSSPDLEALVRALQELRLDVTFLITGRRLPPGDQSWPLMQAALEVVRYRFQRHSIEISPDEEADILRDLFLKFRSTTSAFN